MTTRVELIRKWRLIVNDMAMQFEARWTVMGLRNVDRDMAIRFHEQRELFSEACVTGEPREIVEHGEALARGYLAVTTLMENANVPDDSYLMGVCPTTGFKVAVSTSKAAVDRVRYLYGDEVAMISPDEVATLMASSQAFMTVAAIKKKFPGAEVIERYVNEGS
jgi:hypothetical protein